MNSNLRRWKFVDSFTVAPRSKYTYNNNTALQRAMDVDLSRCTSPLPTKHRTSLVGDWHCDIPCDSHETASCGNSVQFEVGPKDRWHGGKTERMQLFN